MINLSRYYLYGIFLISSFAICVDAHKDELFFSIGLSNFAYKMGNNNVSSDDVFRYSFSWGYSRVDLKGLRSGLGVMCLMKIYQPFNENHIHDERLFGVNLISFLNRPIIEKKIFQFNVGAKSYFDLGGTYNNITIGPTLGFSFKGVSLEYFKGCMDFVDFSLYTDEINIQIHIKEQSND